MPDVIGIRFKSCGKVYDFEVDGIEVNKGDTVVVDSEMGLSIGIVVVERHTLTNLHKELKKVLRKTTEDDIKQKKENEGLESDAKTYCLERVMARGLPMKLISTEATLDRKRIVFYFAAEGRIDFRELVKDLAAKFKTRIEMRQIGVRDEAKIIGGLGICGRELCCKTFLTSFEPISIKMAKSQELVLNANKLSGVCGRLMCCLSYEYSEHEGEDVCGKEGTVPRAGDEEALVDSVDSSPALLSDEGDETSERPRRERGPIETPSQKPDGISTRESRGVIAQPREALSPQKTETPGDAKPQGESPPEGENRPHRRRRRHRRRHHR
jgi:cell fate regulator YaaT (PSP1 superfamily)